MLKVAILGNPNSGKTTLFNQLTGTRQRVGNWGGVTVDIASKQLTIAGQQLQLTDLPGIYSLDETTQTGAVDKGIAIDHIMNRATDLIINVLDATCIDRGLYLTVQLKELGLPVVAVINKLDRGIKEGIIVDAAQLSNALHCPVIAISAQDSPAVSDLKVKLPQLIEQTARRRAITLPLKEQIQAAVIKVVNLQPVAIRQSPLNNKALALKLLEGNSSLLKQLPSAAQQQVITISDQLAADIDIDLQIAECRYQYIYQAVQRAVFKSVNNATKLTERLDSFLLHPMLGIPVFLLTIYLLFLLTINVGGAFIDFFDIFTGAFTVELSRFTLEWLSFPEWSIILLSDGVGAGLQVVATFIPILCILFLCLSLLESSGYMARAAFIVDRLMCKIGLPGEAFIPMVIGLGCSVPAIMATRTLENKQDRIVTAIMSPFMSCSARLPVYVLFAAAFFPTQGQNIIFLLYLIGTAAAISTGLLLRKTILPGSNNHYITELPNYEWPNLQQVINNVWHRLQGFIKSAGKVIVIVVTVLNLTNSIGLNGTLHAQGEGDSLLSRAAKWVTPVLSPMGIGEDNWPATVGIITGIFAKEAVVGALANFYTTAEHKQSQFRLTTRLAEAWHSIGDGFKDIKPQDPIGIAQQDFTNLTQIANEQEVSAQLFNKLQQSFFGSVGGFAYLLFILLYMPCVAAVGAIVREAGKSWALFAVVWSTGLAFMTSSSFYQLAQFTQQPFSALFWVAALISLLVIVYLLLKKIGSKQLVAGGHNGHDTSAA